VLSIEEEAIVVALRKHTLLPLDDCLYALQPTIPHLTRSSLHRCLQRHAISRLPLVEGEASAKRTFKAYPIGYFHIDIAEVRSAQGRLYLLVAIDRTSKFAFVELHENVARRTAADVLRHLIAAVPYKIHTVLPDNGTHFTTPGNTSSAAPDIKAASDAGEPVWAHAFEYACARSDIDHRLTKPKHPWANGQAEQMNRALKAATVRRYYYEKHDDLRIHLNDFVSDYNYARRLKTLKGLTPYEFISKAWAAVGSVETPNQVSTEPAAAHASSCRHDPGPQPASKFNRSPFPRPSTRRGRRIQRDLTCSALCITLTDSLVRRPATTSAPLLLAPRCPLNVVPNRGLFRLSS
jgi:transposase InsO family protein